MFFKRWIWCCLRSIRRICKKEEVTNEWAFETHFHVDNSFDNHQPVPFYASLFFSSKQGAFTIRSIYGYLCLSCRNIYRMVLSRKAQFKTDYSIIWKLFPILCCCYLDDHYACGMGSRRKVRIRYSEQEALIK
jgi:hypothetical protein